MARKVRRENIEADAYSALEEMQNILQSMDGYPSVEDEVEALHKQLNRIQRAVAKSSDPAWERQDEQTRLRLLAKDAVAKMSLPDICPDKDQMDAFVTELVREILGAMNQIRDMRRHKRQAEGIAAARIQGVKFGRSKLPLPNNFDEVRSAWRNGELNLAEAAERCNMAKTSFYNAAVRAERETEKNDAPTVNPPCSRQSANLC